MTSGTAERTPRILAVCTANVCRSPAVERLLRAGLDGTVRVDSAGVQAMVGSPIDPPVAAFLGRNGAGSMDFAARQLTEQMLAEADVVLTMTRAHRAQVVEWCPSAVRRTFTLLEFARVLDSLATPASPADLSAGDRLRAILPAATAGRALAPRAPLGGDDVPDPYGQGTAAYSGTLTLIAEATAAVIRLTCR